MGIFQNCHILLFIWPTYMQFQIILKLELTDNLNTCILAIKVNRVNVNMKHDNIQAPMRENRASGFSNTNQAVQAQKRARGWKFWI